MERFRTDSGWCRFDDDARAVVVGRSSVVTHLRHYWNGSKWYFLLLAGLYTYWLGYVGWRLWPVGQSGDWQGLFHVVGFGTVLVLPLVVPVFLYRRLLKPPSHDVIPYATIESVRGKAGGPYSKPQVDVAYELADEQGRQRLELPRNVLSFESSPFQQAMDGFRERRFVEDPSGARREQWRVDEESRDHSVPYWKSEA